MTKNKIDHIAIKVDSIEVLRPAFEGIGIKCSPTETREDYGMKLAFLDTGEGKIELLEVINEKAQ